MDGYVQLIPFRLMPLFWILGLTLGCGAERTPEDPSLWYSAGTDLSPNEPIVFTETPYDDPSDDTNGIGTYADLFEPYLTAYAPDSVPAAAATCEWSESNALPFDVEGVITLHPRYYYKTDGCADSREKYYGSYFIEDSTGGFFVLGDSKVGHFTMGDRVRLRVHGIREAYEMPMVINAEVLEIDRTAHEIYFEPATGPLGPSDISRVRRVQGTVITGPDTFGEFKIEDDQGNQFLVKLDMELSRRGVSVEEGALIQATGPVLYAYDEYGVIISRLGQLEEFSQAPSGRP